LTVGLVSCQDNSPTLRIETQSADQGRRSQPNWALNKRNADEIPRRHNISLDDGRLRRLYLDCVKSNSARVGLQDLTFVTGTWRADWNGGAGEEHWSDISGDSLLGTFRFVKDARRASRAYADRTDTGWPGLRLRHFSPGLVGWEDKHGSITFV